MRIFNLAHALDQFASITIIIIILFRTRSTYQIQSYDNKNTSIDKQKKLKRNEKCNSIVKMYTSARNK